VIGDFLYQLTGRDRQLGRHEIFRRRLDQSANATNLQATFFSNREFVTKLTRVTFVLIAGGAQTTLQSLLEIQQADGSGNAIGIVYAVQRDSSIDGLTGTVSRSYHIDGVWLPPQHVLVAQAQFSAGVAANEMQCTVWGITVPRGNIIS